MAEASIKVHEDNFCCSVCLDLLKDPVTTPCGHNFCKVCINNCWDQDKQRGVYSCPQCRVTFSPRPVLLRNNAMAEVVEQLNKQDLQPKSSDYRYAASEDVQCDFCTGRKYKAVKSCLVCLVSLCETHLKPHLELPALKKHQLIKASTRLQEKICPQHDRLVEIYCRTDQICICYLCTMHEHKGHDTVAAVAERSEKQTQLEKMKEETQKRIQEKQKKWQELDQAVKTLNLSAQAAVKESERIFTELIQSFEKKRSEVTELIRAQETAEVSHAKGVLKTLEQEITDLRKRDAELEQLPHTEDHIHFLQTFQSLCVSSGSEDSTSITVNQHLSFDEVNKSLSGLKKLMEQFYIQNFNRITEHARKAKVIVPPTTNTRRQNPRVLEAFLRPGPVRHNWPPTQTIWDDDDDDELYG